MDLSKLSSEDLLALRSGDLSKLSNEALVHLRSTAVPAAPAPAAPIAPTAAQETGAWGAIPIAAGKTFDSVLDGLTQMVLKARGETSALGGLKQNVDEKAALYKPLQEEHPITTAIGEALPSMAVPVGGAASTLAGTVGRLAAAGGVPGALEYGSTGERLGRGATGAVAGVAGGVLAPKIAQAVATAVPAIGRTGRAIVEPLTEAGRQRIVGRALNTAAGDTAPDVITRLGAAAPLVPNSLPTAAQVAENGGIAALERSVSSRAPADFTQRGMEQASARLNALRGIAGDDVTRAAAVQAREAASGPLYQQAKAANYTMDGRLQNLLQTPNMRKALAKAEEMAANDGRSFSFSVDHPNAFAGVGIPDRTTRQVTGQGLQDIKMAVDAMLSDPASGFAGKAGDQVRAQRGQLLKWMEEANPTFKAARTTHADMSRPINQMDIGQQLLQKVEPALADYGALGQESGAKYALALRNADQTARTATKFKGAGMEQIMEPAQMDTLNAIAQDLARKSNAQNLGRGAGSNTFQNFAMDNIAGQSGAPRVLGAAMNLPGVSKVAKFLYSGPEEKIQTGIARALLDPREAAALMGSNVPAAPINAKDLLLGNPSRAAQLVGGATGLSLGSFFAQ